MSGTQREIRIGDVYMVEFTGVGCEQHGVRPAVIFQNNTGNKFSPNVIALPMTSVMKKKSQPTHVFISAAESGLLRDSIVLCENPERVSKCRLGAYVTTLTADQMKAIAVASLLAMGAISFLDDRVLFDVRQRAQVLNRLKS